MVVLASSATNTFTCPYLLTAIDSGKEATPWATLFKSSSKSLKRVQNEWRIWASGKNEGQHRVSRKERKAVSCYPGPWNHWLLLFGRCRAAGRLRDGRLIRPLCMNS
jgi:hypothetical protein